ncbi:MAG TPA: DUF6440 family protein [Corynebacterium sp.]|nr:DUF6440 family protein [Corynebacterium sp.]
MKRFREIHQEKEGLTRRVILVDTDTGVCYLQFTRSYGGGITPLLDAEGKPVRAEPGQYLR